MKPKDPAKIEALHHAVLKLNEELGLRNVTVPRLAQQAGIAVGTFYVYFPAKEDLYKDLYWKIKKGSVHSIFEDLDPDGPFRPQFKTVCRAYFLFCLKNLSESRFLEAYQRSEFLDPETQTLNLKLVEPLIRMLIRGQQEELVHPGNPGLLIRCVLGILKEAAAHYSEAGKPITVQDEDTVVRLAVSAIMV
jgi:AcrR family transcriptional regulator